MVHADCGAYGKKFKNESNEQKFLREELRRAGKAVADLLKSQYPRLKIEQYLADFKGLSILRRILRS
jgi:hypothetical protein